MPSPFKNPDLMVIGDSLAQGCRSFSITPEFCQFSYPAIIAAEQGWRFNSPQLPDVLLADLEDCLRRYLNPFGIFGIGRLIGRIQKNFRDWRTRLQAPPKKGPEWTDNLAVTGANLTDLDLFSWEHTHDVLAETGEADLLELMRAKKADVMDLHLAINSGFLLNPHGLAKYAKWNALRWVAERRPKRLLVHLGHNNGLYRIGSNAVPFDLTKTTLPKYLRVIDAIEAATISNQKLIFVLLPKISAVANLAVGDGLPNAAGYCPLYTPEFSTSSLTFNADQMQEMDRVVKRTNIAIRERLRVLAETRDVTVIDTYDILESKDFKNGRNPKAQIVIGKTTVDNRYIYGRGTPVYTGGGQHQRYLRTDWNFTYGGFQSLDGMHPSAVGYAEFAIEVMKGLNLAYDKETIRRDGLRREKLITKYAGEFISVLRLMHLFRSVPEDAGGTELAESQQSDAADTIHIIEALRQCATRS